MLKNDSAVFIPPRTTKALDLLHGLYERARKKKKLTELDKIHFTPSSNMFYAHYALGNLRDQLVEEKVEHLTWLHSLNVTRL